MELPTESKIFLVYGSLRAGSYNFRRFEHGLYLIGQVHLNGFRMFDLGPYPACIKDASDKAGTTIICDVLMTKRRYIAELIDAMERGAGFEAVYTGGALLSVAPHGLDKGFQKGMKVAGRTYVMPDVPTIYPELSGDWLNKKVIKAPKKQDPVRFGVDDKARKEAMNRLRKAGFGMPGDNFVIRENEPR